jgi:hypothetical protein
MSDASPMSRAISDLKLSPQEQRLYEHHLNNLNGDGKVVHPNGDISTLYQTILYGSDGLYHNVPTVWNGKILHPQDAGRLAEQIGWSEFPGYTSPEIAESRYQQMHKYIDEDTQNYLRATRQ